MKKIFPVILTLFISSPSIADTVFLNNGQSFKGDLIRVTSSEVVVTIGGAAEIDFDISTIARVEDDTGNVLFQRRKMVVPESSESDRSDDRDNGTVYSPRPRSTRISHLFYRGLKKGSLAFGGLVSFSSFGGDINEGAYEIGNNERLNLFAIAPSITFFLFDNIGLGADVMYKREWFSNHFEDQLSLGPRVIYAFPLDKTVRPYVGAGIGLLRWRFSEDERAYSSVGMTVKAGPGLFYFVNEHYAVNMELTYKWDRFGTDLEVYPITGNSLLFSIGLSGFIY